VIETQQQQQGRIKRNLRQRRQHAHDRPNHGIDRGACGSRDADADAEDDRNRESGKKPD